MRYHLDYTTLREHAAELGADRLILTHMSAAMLDRLDEADHPAACDGLTVTV